MLISIIVPCYNEEEVLPLFKAKFCEVMATLPDMRYELVLVNDGSSDGTEAIMQAMAEEDPCVRALSFSRNFGKEAAMRAGLDHATGDLVAIMDADLQDPPELLPQMLDIMAETGCDCVTARRATRDGEPWLRSLFSRLFYWLNNRMSPVQMESGVRDFRLMRREMVQAVLRLSERRRFIKGLFAWVGFDVRYLSYDNVERAAGKTKWSFWSLLVYALEGTFNMTALPLALPNLLGALTLLTALVLVCFAQWGAALLCGVAGIILLCFGLLGQYITRIYWEAQKRPLYLTKKDD